MRFVLYFADPSLDRPLLTLVRHRRADLRRTRPFRWLIGVSPVLLGAGVALDPEVRQITTSGVSVVIGVGLLAHYSFRSRRLARVEERPRSRLSPEGGPRLATRRRRTFRDRKSGGGTVGRGETLGVSAAGRRAGPNNEGGPRDA
jgi:hypothetical protein